MNFGEQIKLLRAERGLTQEQMAEKLCVTRQAVSNWENDRNLPDIELLITMAKAFDISLDQLILGEKDMNNMTEKLIADGGETRRAKLSLAGVCVGAALLLIGAALLGIKAASVTYIDAQGILHESFFLIPAAFLFLFGGFIAFVVTGIASAVYLNRSNRAAKRKRLYIGICTGVALLCVGGFLVLLAGNSGANTAAFGVVTAFLGAACLIAAIFRTVCSKTQTD